MIELRWVWVKPQDNMIGDICIGNPPQVVFMRLQYREKFNDGYASKWENVEHSQEYVGSK